jgi:predicted DNA-binding transcriptional regulator YafY
VDSRTVAATYVREDGHRSIRQLEPHARVINSPAWYLLARDIDRGATRTFRLDRFVDVQVGEATFTSMGPQMVRDALESQGVVLERI